MEKFNKKQLEYLENKGFKIYNEENEFELETWTNGGVDMFITFDTESTETALEQFYNYINNFDMDNEIDLYRQNERYKNDFTITQSVHDFEDYIHKLERIYNELETMEEKEKLKMTNENKKLEENFIKVVKFINKHNCKLQSLELSDFLQEQNIEYIYFENIKDLFNYYNEDFEEHYNTLTMEYCIFCEDESIFKLTY